MEIVLKELISEINNIFPTDCENITLAGDYEEIFKNIVRGCGAMREEKYHIGYVCEQYESLKRLVTEPE